MTKSLVGHKAPVTTRALVQRINRKLAADGRVLRSPRGRGLRSTFGDYFITGTDRHVIVDTKVNLATLARKLGVLENWEEVEG